jgi:YidC/Oxa1 family membrane protein insertase
MIRASRRALQSHLRPCCRFPASRNVFTEVQSGLMSFQELTQLPWWISIGVSTVIVKTTLLPIVRYQIMASQRFARIMPEMTSLFGLLKQNLAKESGNDPAKKLAAVKSFTKGFRASMEIHDARLAPVIAAPLLNMSLFVTFVWSVRDMVQNSSSTGVLSTGGAWWFENLTVADSTMVLPVAAMSCSYLALELAFKNGAGPYLTLFKDVMQCVVVMALPVTCSLPAGVFCYWIPSSLFGILQSRMMKDPAVMKALGIPEMPKPASSLRVPS